MPGIRAREFVDWPPAATVLAVMMLRPGTLRRGELSIRTTGMRSVGLRHAKAVCVTLSCQRHGQHDIMNKNMKLVHMMNLPEARDLTDGCVPRIKVWMAGSEACSKQIGAKLDVVAASLGETVVRDFIQFIPCGSMLLSRRRFRPSVPAILQPPPDIVATAPVLQQVSE